MNIQEIQQKIKHLFIRSDATLVLLIIVVALGSFFLGRASQGTQLASKQAIPEETSNKASVIQTHESEGFEDKQPASIMTREQPGGEQISSQSEYVASKSGTKYHLPWCGSAKRIKEENKIWFSSKAEAEAAGYEPASNCKGI